MLCARCRMFFDGDRECEYVGTLAGGEMCSGVRWLLATLACTIALAAACLGRRRGLFPCLSSKAMARIADAVPAGLSSLADLSKAQKEV
mmetsp:Transcript_39937/g.105653  ORF Transcript_39937/g.105653 Transcript_39937/m.105653 type:complete len:89 (-) Transcript_39937:55-321(-)